MINVNLPGLIEALNEKYDIAIKILSIIYSCKSSSISSSAILNGISLSNQSEALFVIDELCFFEILAKKKSLYELLLPIEEYQRLADIFLGVYSAKTKLVLDDIIKIVLTMPSSPSQLNESLRKYAGVKHIRIQDTKDTFNHLAYKAKERITIMTPFLDDDDAIFLMNMLRDVPSHIEKTLILRFISKGPSHHLYPQGFEKIKLDLYDLNVRVYDYAISCTNTEFLETFHAKVVMADNRYAYLGSSNFNRYSFGGSMEMGVYLEGKVVKLIDGILKTVLEISLRVIKDF